MRTLSTYFSSMKKTALTLLSLVLFAPSALAATIYSDFHSVIDENEVQELAPVKITSTSDGDITAEHGINILIAPFEKILFDDTALTITGKAIENGRVNLNVKPVYSSDYKSVFIPVMENWEGGDWLNIEGLTVKAYFEGFNAQKLGLDLDGDLEAEVEDINTYYVGNDVKGDIYPTFPVANVEHTVNDNGSISITWDLPPDYDYFETLIDRMRVKDGFTQTANVYSDYVGSFTDTDLKDVTEVTYTIWSKDEGGNLSESVELYVDLTEPVEEEEEPAEEPADEPADEPEASESEVEELTRLMNYYNVRYSIKCKPGGVAVAENDSACLWARIDLIYSQEVTGDELVTGLALSDRDKDLMQTRRKWSEMRYEDNCELASESASYCSALGKALDRVSYFLD